MRFNGPIPRVIKDSAGRSIPVDRSMSSESIDRYANVDRHLAAHQKPLILIRLSDYSAVAARAMEMSTSGR